jgi:hypothetical protein
LSFFNRLAKAISLGIVVSSVVSSASAATNPKITVHPKARIVSKVDNEKVTVIAHSHPSRVAGMTDLGRLPASTPLHKMTMILKSSDEQEYALVSLLDQQQDKSHANYHQWTTPAIFGAAFGVHADDLTKVTGWLQSSGFSIDKVATGGRFIQFSGVSGQVETAFHTEMHSYSANGVTSISNSTDVSIPEALTPVVRGLLRLNNLTGKPASASTGVTSGVREADGTMHTVSPHLTTGTPDVGPTGTAAGTHFLGAADLAAIYDTTPLLAKGINGKGISIGIVGSSDILPGDVATYRSVFGLPVNPPTVTPVGPDPGIAGVDPYFDFPPYESQGLVDLEIAGALAPMATIVYAPTGYSDFDLLTTDLSASYLVDENVTDIIVDSYNLDETDLTDNSDGVGISYDYEDVVFYQILWEQAAAQGQSVFVTAGTGGADSAGAGSTSGGAYSVNGIASTAYNVAVGSTEFNEGAATYSTLGPTSFWGAGTAVAPYESVLSYIPENAWNQGKYGVINGAAIAGATGTTAGGGGISAYSLLPNWQVGPASSTNVPTVDPVPGTGIVAIANGYYQIAGTSHRLMPDVSTTNGSHDGIIYCVEGSCTLSSTGTLQAFSVMNGASLLTAGAPTMAGIQALINQQQAALNPNSPSSTRQGNPNFFYYPIAAAQNETACDSDTYLTTGTSACGFHDIQTGNTFTPASTKNTTEVGWPAGVGFDLATGLGSPDAANLAALWSTVKYYPTTVGFNVVDEDSSSSQVQPIVITHGDYLSLTINVFPVDGSGNPNLGVSDSSGNEILPSGDVGIIAQEANSQGGVGFYTVTTPAGQNGTGCANNENPPAPGVTASGTLCFGVPGDGNPYDSLEGGALNMSGNLPAIPGGTYNLYAHYAGDTTYAASNSQLVSVVVAPEITTLEVDSNLMATSGDLTGPDNFTNQTPPYTSFTYGQNVYLDSLVNFQSGYGTPTGTITFTLNNGAANLPVATSKLDDSNDAYFDAGPGSGASGYDVLPTYPVLPIGVYSIVAKYSGDPSFAPSTAPSFSIQVSPAPPTIAVVSETADTPVGGTATLVATVANAAPAQFAGGYTAVYATGTVTFIDTTATPNVVLGTSTTPMVNGAVSFTVPNGLLNSLGAHTFTATYNGDSNYLAGTATFTGRTKAPTVTVVAGAATTIAVTAPTSYQVGASASLSATITPATATGTVAFYANGAEIATATAAAGKATGTVKTLAAGTYAITATYGGSATLAASNTTASQTLVITQNTPTVTIAGAPTGDAGSGYTISAVLHTSPNNEGTSTLPNPLPNATFNFYQGTTLLGSAVAVYTPVTFTYVASFTTTALTTGASTITATFVGDANYATASASETITLGTTAVVFSVPSPTTFTVGTGEPTPLKVTVTPIPGSITPITGTVSFSDGGTSLGAAVPVTSAGVATVSPVLAAGTHTITATYSGDSHFTGSSATLTANLVASGTAGFTISISPAALTVQQGGAATTTVTAVVTGNWTGTAPVTCTGLPINSRCFFTYGTGASGQAFAFTGANGSFSGTLTIVTSNQFAAKSGTTSGLLWLPALLLAGFLGIRRKQISLRGRQLLLMAILLCASLATTACGSQMTNLTPPGTVTATVVATGIGTSSASPSMAPTAALAITVTQ